MERIHAPSRPASPLEPVRIAGATTGADALAERLALSSTEQIVPSAGFVPDIELQLTAAPDEVSVLPGAPTRVWRFAGRMGIHRRPLQRKLAKDRAPKS